MVAKPVFVHLPRLLLIYGALLLLVMVVRYATVEVLFTEQFLRLFLGGCG